MEPTVSESDLHEVGGVRVLHPPVLPTVENVSDGEPGEIARLGWEGEVPDVVPAVPTRVFRREDQQAGDLDAIVEVGPFVGDRDPVGIPRPHLGPGEAAPAGEVGDPRIRRQCPSPGARTPSRRNVCARRASMLGVEELMPAEKAIRRDKEMRCLQGENLGRRANAEPEN